MDYDLLELQRLELVELIDKVQAQIDSIHKIYPDLHTQGCEAEPLKWLDFTIVLDHWIVRSTMLYDKLKALRDIEDEE